MQMLIQHRSLAVVCRASTSTAQLRSSLLFQILKLAWTIGKDTYETS